MLKPRLEKFYEKIVCEDLILLYNLKNISQLPTFEKAILNSTSNRFISDKSSLLQCFCSCLLNTSQKGTSTRARKSIALFGIRKSNLLGLKVTLRKTSLFTFLDKLLLFVLPRQLTNLKIVESQTTTNQSSVDLEKPRLASPTGVAAKKERLIHNQEDLTSLSTSYFKISSYLSDHQMLCNKKALKKYGSQSNVKGEVGDRNAKEKKLDFVNKGPARKFLRNFLTISSNTSLVFPEVSQLLAFFDSSPGFSLSCSFVIPHKKRLTKFIKPKTQCFNKTLLMKVQSPNQRRTQLLSAFQYPVSVK